LKDLAELAKNNDILDIMVKLFDTDINAIKNAKEDSDNKLSEIFAKTIQIVPKEELEKHLGSVSLDAFSQHDEKLTENVNIAIFAEAFQRLNKQKAQDSVITFEKDDDNIIHFISSAANLRMFCFNIERQSFNEIKNMAGNIVPAIASTNSIVSGIEIIEMMKHVKNQREKMKSYFVQNLNTKVIGLKTETNLETCQICHSTSIPVIVSTNLSNFRL
jgi:ubiquitin-like 1-activating enzyme E1 B